MQPNIVRDHLRHWSHGVLDDMKSRSRGTGADIIIRPPDSSGFTFSLTMNEKVVDVVRAKPHVKIATGTFVVPVSVALPEPTGLPLASFTNAPATFSEAAKKLPLAWEFQAAET